MYEMGHLKRLSKMDETAATQMKAFWDFDKAAFTGGAVSEQVKQLIAVGVALTTQCPYCIELHGAEARKLGATDEMLAEVAAVAAAMRAGAAMTHATHLFRA